MRTNEHIFLTITCDFKSVSISSVNTDQVLSSLPVITVSRVPPIRPIVALSRNLRAPPRSTLYRTARHKNFTLVCNFMIGLCRVISVPRLPGDDLKRRAPDASMVIKNQRLSQEQKKHVVSFFHFEENQHIRHTGTCTECIHKNTYL